MHLPDPNPHSRCSQRRLRRHGRQPISEPRPGDPRADLRLLFSAWGTSSIIFRLCLSPQTRARLLALATSLPPHPRTLVPSGDPGGRTPAWTVDQGVGQEVRESGGHLHEPVAKSSAVDIVHLGTRLAGRHAARHRAAAATCSSVEVAEAKRTRGRDSRVRGCTAGRNAVVGVLGGLFTSIVIFSIASILGLCTAPLSYPSS